MLGTQALLVDSQGAPKERLGKVVLALGSIYGAQPRDGGCVSRVLLAISFPGHIDVTLRNGNGLDVFARLIELSDLLIKRVEIVWRLCTCRARHHGDATNHHSRAHPAPPPSNSHGRIPRRTESSRYSPDELWNGVDDSRRRGCREAIGGLRRASGVPAVPNDV